MSIEDNLGYEPTSIVTTAHRLPRLILPFHLKSTAFEANVAYVESSSFIPVVFLAIITLSLFVYHCICCCITCKSLKCVDYDHIDDDITEIEYKVAKKIAFKRRLALGFFVALLICMICSNNVMFGYGDSQFVSGISALLKVWNELKDNLVDTSKLTVLISSYSSLYGMHLIENAGSCSDSGIAQVEDKLFAVEMFADQLTSKLHSFHSSLLREEEYYAYVEDNKDYYLLRVYLGGYAVIVMYLLAGLCRTNKGYPKIVITLMGLIVLALSIASCVLLTVLVIFGDVCMKPNTIIANELNSTAFVYYMNCTGPNPLDLTELYDSVDYINRTLYGIIHNESDSSCSDNPTILGVYTNMSHLYHLMDSVEQNSNCDTTQAWLYDIINVSLCVNIYNSIAVVWVCIFSYSIFLFFLNFNAGIIYQYTNTVLWNMDTKESTVRLYETLPNDPVTTTVPAAESRESNQHQEIQTDAANIEDCKALVDVEYKWSPRSMQAMDLAAQVDLQSLYHSHYNHIHDELEVQEEWMDIENAGELGKAVKYKPLRTITALKTESHSIFAFMYWNHGKIHPTSHVSAVADRDHFSHASEEYWSCSECHFNNHNSDICFGCGYSHIAVKQETTAAVTITNKRPELRKRSPTKSSSALVKKTAVEVNTSTEIVGLSATIGVSTSGDIIGCNAAPSVLTAEAEVLFNDPPKEATLDLDVDITSVDCQELDPVLPIDNASDSHNYITNSISEKISSEVITDLEELYTPVEELYCQPLQESQLYEGGPVEGVLVEQAMDEIGIPGIQEVPLDACVMIEMSALDALHADLAQMHADAEIAKQLVVNTPVVEATAVQIGSVKEKDIIKPIVDSGWYCSSCFHFNKTVAAAHCGECGSGRELNCAAKRKKKANPTVIDANGFANNDIIPVQIPVLIPDKSEPIVSTITVENSRSDILTDMVTAAEVISNSIPINESTCNITTATNNYKSSGSASAVMLASLINSDIPASVSSKKALRVQKVLKPSEIIDFSALLQLDASSTVSGPAIAADKGLSMALHSQEKSRKLPYSQPVCEMDDDGNRSVDSFEIGEHPPDDDGYMFE